ncbi:hypothetical protein D3C86_1648560 [compost metagenome]
MNGARFSNTIKKLLGFKESYPEVVKSIEITGKEDPDQKMELIDLVTNRLRVKISVERRRNEASVTEKTHKMQVEFNKVLPELVAIFA